MRFAIAVAAGTWFNVLHAAAPLPPAELFFREPVFQEPELSPDGSHLAARILRPAHRTMLAVVNLKTKKADVVARFEDRDVHQLQWISDTRLLFQTAQAMTGFIASSTGIHQGRMFAVNRDGGNFRELGINPKMDFPLSPMMSLYSKGGAGNSETALVGMLHSSDSNNQTGIRLVSIDTSSDRYAAVHAPGDVLTWILDHQGKPRFAITREQGKLTAFSKLPGQDHWQPLPSLAGLLNGGAAFEALAAGADNVLYLSTNDKRDTRALYRLDLQSGRLEDKPLVELGEYDFTGMPELRNGKLAGVRYLREGWASVWFDPEMKKVQEEVDRLLPATVNLLEFAAQPQARHVLVHAFSDIQPSLYFIFDLDQRTLARIGESYPGINPKEMGTQDPVRFTTRDGRAIPAMLTLPPGQQKRKLPLIVLAHDGPHSRGSTWEWRPQIQFLASRGYAVLEPEYRGSEGFGASHLGAGMKQWADGMVNDVVDSTRWAIANGYADPARICVGGQAFGGYLAMHALARDASLYRCGFEWGGISDIAMQPDGWFHLAGGRAYKLHQADLLANKQQAPSVIAQAHRIKAPLLIAHGKYDWVTPPANSVKLRDALVAGNKSVEWVLYDDEDHSWSSAANRIDLWTRVEKFLDKHLGVKPAP